MSCGGFTMDGEVTMKDRRITVLVVDDEQANLMLLDTILRGTYDILLAQSASEATDVVREQVPDLILFDVMMPGMRVFALCRQLKVDELYRDIPVFFITAMSDGDSEL